MISEVLQKLVEGSDLSESEAAGAMEEIMAGEATPVQIAGFLTALRMKGETVAEIAGLARTMRERAARIRPTGTPLVDTCGTGGDGAGTLNISTAAAFVIAGAGLPVAKHGNRALSSRCGSADVLEALGVRVDLPPPLVERCIDEVGIGFLFAPAFHRAMKHAMGPRRELGFRTVFNVLGPLTNPAGATAQAVGVYRAELVPVLAEVLLRLGVSGAYVFHGLEGLDELSVSGRSLVATARDGRVETFYLEPEELGLPRWPAESLAGGDAETNARALRGALAGEEGSYRDAILLNAAAGLAAAGRARDLSEGLEVARSALDSGQALARLDALADFTRRVAAA